MQKEDLFDAHNFDIEIDVDTNLIGKNFSPFSLFEYCVWAAFHRNLKVSANV